MDDLVDALPPGTLLGHYRLQAAASRGGFGVLYRAWDEKLNRPVAVKECFPASICRRDADTGAVLPHSESLKGRYEAVIADAYAEAQTLAGLHHARVVPVYDIFRAAGSLFYVMPWLEGGSRRDKIAAARETGAPVPQADALRWLLELLSALEYLHGRQVIHRDLKPGNIMFDAAGNPVLVDFGSALNRATKVDTTTQGEFSPVYASPEQVSGKGKMGPWTDLYSLAATWYELLSGSPPEPAQQRLLQDELVGLSLGPTVLEQSIMQNLALDSAQRCQSAQEWLDWLLQGAAPCAVVRRRKMLWLKISAGLLVVGTGAFYLGTLQAPRPMEPPVAVAQAPRPVESPVVVAQAPRPVESPATVAQAPLESEDSFYQRELQALGLPARMQDARQRLTKAQELMETHKRKVDDLLAEMRKLAAAPGSDAETRSRIVALAEQFEQRRNAVSDQLRDEHSPGIYDALGEIHDKLENPESTFPVESPQELLLLKKIAPRLESLKKEYSELLDAYLLQEQEIYNYGDDAVEEIISGE